MELDKTRSIEELFDYILDTTPKSTKFILDNVGIKVHLGLFQEYREYFDYVVTPFLIRAFRKIFRKGNIEDLHLKAMAAIINKTIETGEKSGR